MTNLCHNAVDRHLKDRADQNALIFVSTEVDKEQVYSFRVLHAEVQRMAASLRSLGVTQGDRVLIYMPMIPEATFAMLACARIGAIHSGVFGGFASGSRASRIDDSQPTVIVSADAGSRGGKVVAYKPLLDEAIRLAQNKPGKVLMVDRGLVGFDKVDGRDVEYAALRAQHLNAEVPDSRYAKVKAQVDPWTDLVRETCRDRKVKLERKEREIVGHSGPISEGVMTAGADPEAAELILPIYRWLKQIVGSGQRLLGDTNIGLERMKVEDWFGREKARVVPFKKVHCGENGTQEEKKGLKLVRRRLELAPPMLVKRRRQLAL